MVYIIIGAAGFLGRHLSGYCSSRGIEVIGVDVVPCEDEPAFKEYYRVDAAEMDIGPILEKWAPYCLVNMAGNSTVRQSFLDPAGDFRNGPRLFQKILEAVRISSPETRVLFLSSAAVYGQPLSLPIREDMPLHPISSYGYGKVMSEILAKEYSSIYGLKTAVLRVFSAYGAGLKKQILWDLCTKCRNGGQIMLNGSGNESRDFIHVEDICQAALLIAGHDPLNAQPFNVASGDEVSIRDLASCVLRSYGLSEVGLVFSGESVKGDPANWRADISRLEELGFVPTVRLEEGVSDYVRWFRDKH